MLKEHRVERFCISLTVLRVLSGKSLSIRKSENPTIRKCQTLYYLFPHGISRIHPHAQRSGVRRSTHCRRMPLPDPRSIQSPRHAVHLARRLPILDQPLHPERRLPVHVADPEDCRSPARNRHRLPRRLRRTRHRRLAFLRSAHANRKLLRTDLHGIALVLLQLPRSHRAPLAILRSLPRPLGPRPLLHDLPHRRQRKHALHHPLGVRPKPKTQQRILAKNKIASSVARAPSPAVVVVDFVGRVWRGHSCPRRINSFPNPEIISTVLQLVILSEGRAKQARPESKDPYRSLRLLTLLFRWRRWPSGQR